MTRAAADIVATLVNGDREGWRVGGWKDDARAVLEEVIACGDPDARRAAPSCTH